MSGSTIEGLQKARRGIGVRGNGRPITTPRRRPTRGGLTLLLFALPSLILLLLINLYPLLYAGMQSVRAGNLINLGKFVGLTNYLDVLSTADFWHSALFTLIFTVTGVFGSWLVGLGLALLLRTKIPANGLFKVLLLLPGTYMNESGRAVSEALGFYKLSVNDVIVFHDELELTPFKVRVKVGGGNAGHNGLRSISQHIGNDYRRVRLGIGHPGDKKLVERYVLADFAKDEWAGVEALCDIVADNVSLLLEGKDSSFQNKIHLTMTAKGFGDDKEQPASDA